MSELLLVRDDGFKSAYRAKHRTEANTRWVKSKTFCFAKYLPRQLNIVQLVVYTQAAGTLELPLCLKQEEQMRTCTKFVPGLVRNSLASLSVF